VVNSAPTALADPESERGLLGSLMLDAPGALAQVNGLRAEDFAEERHRRIYAGVRALVADGTRVDPVALQRSLATHGVPVSLDYLADLSLGAFTTTSVPWHAGQVADCARRRGLVELAERLGRDARDPSVPVANALAVASSVLASTLPVAARNRFRRFTVDEALTATAAGIEWLPCLQHDGFVIQGTSTLLAAGPKAGKTYTSSWMVTEWLEMGHRVLWITEESLMAWGSRLRRLEAAGVDLRLWHDGLEPVNPAGASPAELLALAVASKADIVILDTVRTIAGIVNENDAAEVSRALRPWIEAIVNVGGRTLICIHYVRKSGGEAGEGVAGSHAFRSEVDTILELVRDKEFANRRSLRGESRIVPISTVITQLGEDDRITVLGSPSQVVGRELERLVVEALGEGGRLMKTSELHVAISPRPALATLKRALERLGTQRHILRDPPIGVDAARQTVRWGLREQLSM
jgi:hypothetical protein